MPEQRNLFDLAAADAATVRIAARDELAVNLANEILRNPAKFDPNRLKALGSQGFLVLLAKIRQHEVRKPESLRNTSAGRSNVSMASSWQHLRKPEPNRWLRSLAAGLCGGLSIVAIGFAVAAFS